MPGCEYQLREVAPSVWGGSYTAAQFVGAGEWVRGRDSVLHPVLGWYAVCDEHGTADPSTHTTEAAARRWTCPLGPRLSHHYPGILHRDDKWKD